MRIRKDVVENEELVEEDVRKEEEVDIVEQSPSCASGAAMRTSTTQGGARR